MVKDCETAQDWEQLLADSHDKPVFLLKHSTRCGISASAWRAFQGYAKTGNAGFWRVLVVEDRPLSQQIARESRVQHQSPQTILFRQGKPVWDTSHGSITAQEMSAALSAADGV